MLIHTSSFLNFTLSRKYKVLKLYMAFFGRGRDFPGSVRLCDVSIATKARIDKAPAENFVLMSEIRKIVA